MTDVPKALLQALVDAIELGPGEAMRQGEIARGAKIVMPGSVPWLPVDDWIDDIVVSQIGINIRIVAVFARKPGTGAFSRLVTGIAKAGLWPVVVCPFPDMDRIVRRWGWTETIVGATFDDQQDQWMPSREWLLERAKRADP
jgi:hypothetical protein